MIKILKYINGSLNPCFDYDLTTFERCDMH
nr:MAG TPA: hypothetical protein [Caudoviricetes sp.]